MNAGKNRIFGMHRFSRIAAIFAYIIYMCAFTPITVHATVSGLNAEAYIPPAFNDSHRIGFAGREWVVAGTPASGVATPSGTITLLDLGYISGASLLAEDNTPYRTYSGSGQYDGTYANLADYNTSTLMSKMTAIAARFTPKELSYVSNRSLDGISGAAVTNQALWPLSKMEFDALYSATPADNRRSLMTYGSVNGGFSWFLRSSPGGLNGVYYVADFDGNTGTFTVNEVNATARPRPALYFDASKILFSYEAYSNERTKNGTIVSNGWNTLPTAPYAFTNFVMYDAALNLTSVAAQSISGNTVTVSYSGAPTGKTLSTIIVDASGELRQYRKLIASIASSSGTVDVTIPDGFSASDKLYIFAEEETVNRWRHDLAGTPLHIPLSMASSPSVSGDMRKITGTTTAMEYQKLVYPPVWYDCSNGETPVTPGDYIVRYKQSGSTLAGPSVQVEVLYEKPVLSNVSVTRTGATDANISVTSSEPGGVYMLSLPHGETAPTKEAIKNNDDLLVSIGSWSGGVGSGGSRTANGSVSSGIRDIWLVVDNPNGLLSEAFKIVVGEVVQAENISGIPSNIKFTSNYTLSGVVAPANATNQTIVWSVTNAGTTGAEVSGNTLSLSAPGTVELHAIITNGAYDTSGTSIDYTKDFTMKISGHDLLVTGGIENTDYEWTTDGSRGTINIRTATPMTITGVSNDISISDKIEINGGVTANITFEDISVGYTNPGTGGSSNLRPCPVTVNASATLNLTLIGDNFLYGSYNSSALYVPNGATLNILANSTGSLTANAGQYSSAIGTMSYAKGTCGTINIYGGTINADAGNYGYYGIGGDNKGNINIYGGNITAANATSNGSGNSINGANVYIGGGMVKVIKASASGTAIASSNLIIVGGSVYRSDGSSIGTAATNGQGANVYLTTLTVGDVPVVNTAITAGSINSVDCTTGTPNAANGVYGIKDVSTDDSGKLYFWLPEAANIPVIMTAGGAEYLGGISPNTAGTEAVTLVLPGTATPTLSAGTVNRTGNTAATIGFTTDEAGTAYYKVVNFGAGTPTKQDVIAANNSLGVVFGTVSGKAVTLTAGAKDIYVVVGNAYGISEPLKISVTAYDGPLGVGTGTEQDPYIIYTAADLDEVRNHLDKYFKLANDIDLTAYLSNGGAGFAKWFSAGWLPIGKEGVNGNWNRDAFKGNFDGDGHTISGLYINNITSGTNFFSLFGKVSGATIKNLGVTEVNINSTSEQTGAIAGRLETGTVIMNCYSNGTITVTRPSAGNDAYVGGIVGNATGGSRVENCYSLCDISTNGVGAGGISGRMEGGSLISYCYATSSVSGNGSVGGILGLNNNSAVQNSVAASGSITAATGSTTNRIVGQNSGGAYHNNYANSGMTVNGGTKNDDTSLNGTGKTLADLKAGAFYTTASNWYNGTAWDFTNVWTIDDEVSLPVFKWQSEGLHVNGGALLTAESTIQDAITDALDTKTIVTVTGKLTGVTAMITLNIPAGKKVVWQADYSGTCEFDLIDITGDGSFEVAGGKLNNTGNTAGSGAIALYGTSTTTTLSVTSGELTAAAGRAIFVVGQNKRVFISGGVISSSNTSSVIYFNGTTNNGVLFQSGGTVKFNTGNTGSTISFDSGSNAFAIQWDGTGTEFDYGVTTGLTVSGASTGATAKWVLMDGKSGISYENGENKGFIEVAGVTVVPDTTVPVLSDGSFTRTGATTGSIAFTTNEGGGTLYYLMLASGADAPTTTEILAGKVYPGAVTAGLLSTNVSGISSTAFDVYLLVEDAAGNVSNVLYFAVPAYVAPTYGVSIATFTGGSVSADKADYEAGETVTLTVTPETGYELDGDISAHKTGDTGTTVTFGGTGNTRTFTMPDFAVTVTATFKPFADQTDILNAKAAIEGMTNVTVAQKDANTEDGVKTWLATQINALAALSSKSITVSENDITTGNDFIAAIEGNSSKHSGTNGSFSFTVSLQKGKSAAVTTASNSGTITATIFIPTPTAGDLNYAIPSDHAYNGSAQGIGTVTGATGMGTVTVYYTGTGYAKNTVAPANAGTYTVTADITAGTNYTAATGVSLGNYTIGKATATGVPKEVPVPVNFAQNVNVTLADLLPTLTSPMSYGTVAYTLGSVVNTDGVLGTLPAISDAMLTLPVQSVSDANKTATVNITVSSDNFNDFTAVITVKTVATTALSVTGLAVKAKTYDGNTAATLEGTATLSGIQAGHSVTLSGTPSAAFDNRNAGTNKAVTISGLSLTGTDACWYTLDLSGFTGEISQKALANDMIAAISGQTYNGTAQTPALTVTDGALGTLVLNTDYEITTYSNNKNVGTASAGITGKGNYTGTASANFSINKAAITASSATLAAKTYDGTTAGTASGVTFTGLQNGETLTLGTDFTASAAYDNADAGTNRGATVTVTLSNTAKADNYQIAASGNTVSLSNQTIGKATATGVNQTKGVHKNHAQNVDFDLTTLLPQPESPKTLGTVTYKPVIATNADGVLDALSYNTGNTLALPVKSISEAGKTATVTVTIGSTNYADFTATITVETEDTQDDADIATVKSLVAGENYTTTQVNAPAQAAAKAVVQGIINALGSSLNGVTATVNDGTFTAATAGTASDMNGTNGSYTFTVTLSKGYGTPQTTGTLTLAITATPYDATQDNLDIAAAKTAIESATYTDTQANVPDAAAAKAKVEAIITGLTLNGVTTMVVPGAFTPAIAGTPSNMNGTNGSYKFTVNLNKGGGTQQTTIQLTLTVIATPYDATQDNADITAAKALVENAGYTDTQANIPDAAAAETKVKTVIGALNLNGVTPTVAGGTFAPAIAGTATNLSGTNGSYEFTVNLNKGGGTQQTTVELTLTVTATPYDASQDNADITKAKAEIEKAGYTDTQANIPDAAAAETKVKAIIGNLNLNSVTPTVVPGTFIPAIAGTVSSLSGTNGSYTFTVKLNKGGGTEQITVELTLTVTATPYDATPDNDDITAAKALVENAGYTDTQVNVPDAAAAKSKVEAIIGGLALNGVTTIVIDGTFNPAIAGTATNLSGTNGSYKFTVNLNKGAGTQQTTVQLTLTVTATPYNASQDNADITAAKLLVESAGYTDTQANVPDATAAKAAVEAIISRLNLNGVTATVIPGSFTVAVAGNAGNPAGTNGSYKFTVNLNKGGGMQQTTIQLTLTVTATPYTPPATHLVNISLTTNGAVSANPANPVAENTTVTLTVSPTTGYELDVISAHKDGDASVTVPLNGFNALNALNGTFTMPTYNVTVNATFKKTTDQLAVEAAQTLIEGMNNVTVTQATANTEAAVKTWLAAQINALAGMSTTGITVSAANITLGNFSAAVAGNTGNPPGTNGSFTFSVSLQKGNSVTVTTAGKNGTIIATPYDETQDNADITAAKALVEKAGYTDTQVNVPDAAAAKLKVEAIIGGLALNGVIPTVIGGTFNPAIAGAAGNLSGTDGSYTFTVNLNKGAGTQQTTVQLTLTVTATPYNASQDNADISAAKLLVENSDYTDTQVNVPDAAHAKAAVEAVISMLNLNGVTPTVVPGSFTAAVAGNAGNPAGTNGSYTFTVNLNKGGGTQQTTVQLTLAVTATPYTPPATHLVNISMTTNGTVSANPVNPVSENTTVTLTINPASGYELDAITAHRTGDAATTVTLNGTGNTRTFTMPKYDVTVNAAFKKTADQLTVEAAKTAIEGMSNVTVAQATANTEAAVKTWLAVQINALAGMSATGITVSASDITLSGFSAAVAGNAGNPSGTNGSFTFTVSLKKGTGATVTTAGKNGTIIATDYIAPAYAVTIGATTGGTVTADKTAAAEGTTVTLTLSPNTGYELDTVSTTPSVTLSGTGNTRTFTMPASNVTVNATFKKTQAQLDREAVEAAKAAVEGGTFRIAQATGNDATSVKTWLVNTLNVLFGQSHGLQVKSAQPSIVGDVAITAITPAIAGTEALPDGTNGSFAFTVSLERGATKLTAIVSTGVIVAIPHVSTLVKRIELLLLNDLTARIINTGNVATGDLTLTLSGTNANAFTLPQETVNSLNTGGEANIAITPRTDLAAGTYTATLTVSGEGITPVSVEITYTVTPTGIEEVQAKTLKAYVQNGLLHASGLTVGKTWSIYSISGVLIYQSVAHEDKADFNLNIRGVYIVTSGHAAVKVIY